jgi:electron transfer flavoprotein alpha subunit
MRKQKSFSLMNFLVFAEQRDNKIKKSALEAVSAAKGIAQGIGAQVVALLIGDVVLEVAKTLGDYGASKIIAVSDPKLGQHSNTAYAKVIAEIAKREGAQHIFLPATQMGKDIAPRVAVKLEAGLAADCSGLTVEDGVVIASRPVYAGKAIVDVRVTTPTKVFTLRPNVFTAVAQSGTASVEAASVTLEAGDFGSVVQSIKVSSGRPDLTEADIIVSGGRGLKAPENFRLIEDLADVLGGAVGASRAVVDAGWRPHDEQVGQTGKTVSPTMYIACGISGAVQHLAGMSSSKCIVAINKDKDAPIFQVADYGIIGDVIEILPELTAQLKTMLGK